MLWLYSVCLDEAQAAPVVGGGNDDNGRRDTDRVSTAGLHLNVQ